MFLQKIIPVIGICLTFFMGTIQSANLVEVYADALRNDPSFKEAEANWLSARENLPIARSAYLPQITADAFYLKVSNKILPFEGDDRTNPHGFFDNYGYTLTLNQPIFNASAWYGIKSAGASVKAATATYLAAAQDLIVRVSKAYFSVLQAYDQLRYTIANKKAVYHQLKTAREKFNVGLIAITGVYDAQAAYDRAVASEINDRNSLEDRLEDLRAITNQRYLTLASLGISVPLISPAPHNMNEWVTVAEAQNYDIQSQNYATIAARENIKQQAANHLPVVGFTADYSDMRNANIPNLPNFGTINSDVGVTVSLPVLSGGLINAKTQQARYDFLSSSSRLEFVHRSIVNKTRQSYLGVVTGISQVHADEQSIVSARNAVDATQAGYESGTRTMVELLEALTNLYQAEEQRAMDQYNFILSTISLKQAAGTLSIKDLAQINEWLSKKIDTSANGLDAMPKKTTIHHAAGKSAQVS